MFVAKQKTTKPEKGDHLHLINGFNSAEAASKNPTPKTSENESHSFLLDTVTQLNTDPLRVESFIRYLTQQIRRSQRIEDRRLCKKLFTEKLRKFGFIEEAEKLKKCSANFTALVCENGHSFRPIVDFRCHLPFCPDCWEAKSHREMSRNLPKFLTAIKNDPSLIVAFTTLTLKSDKKRELKKGNCRIKASFRKLRRREMWNNCVGGFGRIENTFSSKFGWHPHLHCLILLKDYIPQKILSSSWKEITQDSMVCDIRQVRDLAAGLVETIKYPFKPADLSRLGKNEIEEMLNARGERLGVSFGVLFGIETDENEVVDEVASEVDYSEFIEETKSLEIGDCCPICSTKLDLVDFTSDGYSKFLGSIPIINRSRGKPS